MRGDFTKNCEKNLPKGAADSKESISRILPKGARRSKDRFQRISKEMPFVISRKKCYDPKGSNLQISKETILCNFCEVISRKISNSVIVMLVPKKDQGLESSVGQIRAELRLNHCHNFRKKPNFT